MEHLFLMFLDHTRRTTVGRTPLDEWSARRTSAWQHTTLTSDKYPCPRWDSNPRSLLRSWVRIPPGAWIFVSCECRVLSGRGLCDGLITRPEESYRLWCVVVCDLETSRIGAPYIYMTLVTSGLSVLLSLSKCFSWFWATCPKLWDRTLPRKTKVPSVMGCSIHCNHWHHYLKRVSAATTLESTIRYIQGVPGGMCQTSRGCSLC